MTIHLEAQAGGSLWHPEPIVFEEYELELTYQSCLKELEPHSNGSEMTSNWKMRLDAVAQELFQALRETCKNRPGERTRELESARRRLQETTDALRCERRDFQEQTAETAQRLSRMQEKIDNLDLSFDPFSAPLEGKFSDVEFTAAVPSSRWAAAPPAATLEQVRNRARADIANQHFGGLQDSREIPMEYRGEYQRARVAAAAEMALVPLATLHRALHAITKGAYLTMLYGGASELMPYSDFAEIHAEVERAREVLELRHPESLPRLMQALPRWLLDTASYLGQCHQAGEKKWVEFFGESGNRADIVDAYNGMVDLLFLGATEVAGRGISALGRSVAGSLRRESALALSNATEGHSLATAVHEVSASDGPLRKGLLSTLNDATEALGRTCRELHAKTAGGAIAKDSLFVEKQLLDFKSCLKRLPGGRWQAEGIDFVIEPHFTAEIARNFRADPGVGALSFAGDFPLKSALWNHSAGELPLRDLHGLFEALGDIGFMGKSSPQLDIYQIRSTLTVAAHMAGMRKLEVESLVNSFAYGYLQSGLSSPTPLHARNFFLVKENLKSLSALGDLSLPGSREAALSICGFLEQKFPKSVRYSCEPVIETPQPSMIPIPPLPSALLQSKKPSEGVLNEISRRLGVPKQELFPSAAGSAQVDIRAATEMQPRQPQLSMGSLAGLAIPSSVPPSEPYF